MTKILIGLLVAACLFAGLQWYRADAAVATAARWEKSVESLATALERQSTSLSQQKTRFEDFDASMLRLETAQQTSTKVLQAKLQALMNFIPQPGDSDETLRCALLPVPADVDRQLRE